MEIRFAQIEPTTLCNYTCGFCVGRTMRQEHLRWEVFEKFLDSHPSLEHVELQGEGEPLLHPRFFDMVSTCKARGIRVSIVSNGSLLNLAAVEHLIAGAVDSFNVSIESAESNEFRSIRGGKLDKVVRGLRLLMKRRRDLGASRPVVGLSVTVLKRTIGAIDGIVALYNELNLDGGISVQWLRTMPCYTDVYDRQMLQEIVPRELQGGYQKLINSALQKADVRSARPTFYSALFADFKPSLGVCPWLERAAYLNVNGAVTGCCSIKNPRHAFGNIMVDDKNEIATQRKQLSERLASGFIPPSCTGCGVAQVLQTVARRRTSGQSAAL